MMVLAAIAVQPLLIRRAMIDISPPELLPLGGYTERHGKLMEAGGDPLYSRCILFQQGKLKIALVSVEMLTVPESLYREVSLRIPKGVKLFMQATHSHSAPDSQMLNDRMTFAIPGIASFKSRWLTWYADKIASSVLLAEKASAIDAKIIRQWSVGVPANRTRRLAGVPDQRKIWLKLEGAFATPFADEPNDTLLTFYTAHPTVYDEKRNQTSGDWIGEEAKRTGAPVLNGAIGDVSPVADGATPEAKMSGFFKIFDDIMMRIRIAPFPVFNANTDKLKWAENPIKLDPTKPHPTFAKSNGIPEPLAKNLVSRFAPPKASVVAFRFGQVAIVGIPGEPTSILGNQIQAAGEKIGFKTVLVCSHVNGWMGYILDPADYDRGGYEASLSFYGRGEGARVVDSAVTALKQLRAIQSR